MHAEIARFRYTAVKSRDPLNVRNGSWIGIGATSRVARGARTASSPTTRGRNRHCPKCQDAAAKDWLAAGQAELLPVAYYHVVFTPPARVADIAYRNKAVIYGMLFKGEPANAIGSREGANAETLITIAADPKHLGARIGLGAVLHTDSNAIALCYGRASGTCLR